jgi:hypothetical protein
MELSQIYHQQIKPVRSKLKDFQAICENGRTDLRLAEQIYNRVSILSGFDEGTNYTVFVKRIFCIFVILRSAKSVSHILSRNFKPKYLHRAMQYHSLKILAIAI